MFGNWWTLSSNLHQFTRKLQLLMWSGILVTGRWFHMWRYVYMSLHKDTWLLACWSSDFGYSSAVKNSTLKFMWWVVHILHCFPPSFPHILLTLLFFFHFAPHSSPFPPLHPFLSVLLPPSDIDECAFSPCSSNAGCMNNPGSFSCTCGRFYTGNGVNCQRMYIFTMNRLKGFHYLHSQIWFHRLHWDKKVITWMPSCTLRSLSIISKCTSNSQTNPWYY